MAIKRIDKTYIQLKNVRLADSTMIKMFNIMQDGDTYFMNIFKTFIINQTILDDPKNIENMGIIDPWWENISNSYYSDVDLWWLACLMNDVVNPYEEINEGETINMLKKVFVPYIHRDMQRIYEA